jgi:hypothetical protein
MDMIPDEFSSYRHIDVVLMPWAKRHGIEVETEDRGWDTRSFWICDRNGRRRGQMWMRDPDGGGNVTVIAAELTPKSPTNWGAREERRASLSSLEQDLDDLWSHMLGWGGPGAIASNYGVYPLDLQHRPPRWGYEMGTERFSSFKAHTGRHAPASLYLLSLALGAGLLWLALHRLGLL